MDGPKTPPTPPTMPAPTPLPGMVWPVDMRQATIGPRFMGHAALKTYRPGYGYHTGTDFFASLGAPVYAVAPGVVESATLKFTAGYGNNVVIRHKQLAGWSRYSHLLRFIVKAGQTVQAGQIIGYVGTSGTDNVHLHFDWIIAALPTPRFNPHNPATGGVRYPKAGLDPIEDALTRKYFANGLTVLSARLARNPVTGKVWVA